MKNDEIDLFIFVTVLYKMLNCIISNKNSKMRCSNQFSYKLALQMIQNFRLFSNILERFETIRHFFEWYNDKHKNKIIRKSM